MTVLEAWNKRRELIETGHAFCDSGHALAAEADRLLRNSGLNMTAKVGRLLAEAEMQKSEGALAFAKADAYFFDTVLQAHGDVTPVWDAAGNVMVDKVTYLKDAGPDEVVLDGTKYKLVRVE